MRLNCSFTSFCESLNICSSPARQKMNKALCSDYPEPQHLKHFSCHVSRRACFFLRASHGFSVTLTRVPVTRTHPCRVHSLSVGGWSRARGVGFSTSLEKVSVEAISSSPLCFSALAPENPNPHHFPQGNLRLRKSSWSPWQHCLPPNLHGIEGQ